MGVEPTTCGLPTALYEVVPNPHPTAIAPDVVRVLKRIDVIGVHGEPNQSRVVSPRPAFRTELAGVVVISLCLFTSTHLSAPFVSGFAS